jgi:WD40 repeat protein
MFEGTFLNKSFYSKSSMSPCGTYLLSGSSSSESFLWDVSDSHYGTVYKFASHDREVSCVAWHAAYPDTLGTCSDDGTVRLWRADYSQTFSSAHLQSKYSQIRESRASVSYRRPKGEDAKEVQLVNVSPLSPITTNKTAKEGSLHKLSHYFSPSKAYPALADKENFK